MKRILIIILLMSGICFGQSTDVPPYIDSFWRDIIDESDTETYGIDLSGGTWSSGFMNVDANPSMYANGTRIMEVNDTDYNAFFGSGAFNNDDGQFNVGFGYQAGNNNTTGAGNKGKFNVYIGTNSGFGDGGGSEGYKNVGIGYRALQYIATGYGNVAIGNEAARNLAGGYSNMAIGAEALYKATIGKWNTAIGTGSLGKLTVGTCDVGVGYYSGYRNTSGHFNLNLGSFSGYYNETGDDNVAIGSYSGGYGAGAVNNHSDDTFIGSLSGYSITTGSSDIFIGYKSGYNQTTNSNLLVIDNQDRGNVTNEPEECLLYGTFAADPNVYPNQQTLKVNGVLSTSNIAHTLAAAATTFVCTSNVMTITGDGGTNTVATITGAKSGTLLTLIFVDGNITLTDTDAHTANTVDLAGTATDLTSADDKTLQIVFNGTSWYEVSRSVN